MLTDVRRSRDDYLGGLVVRRPPRDGLLACLTSLQHSNVSQGRFCSDNCKCCHSETEAADQTFLLTQSQYTDTGPTSPSADPITPDAWQGQFLSHWYDSTRKNPGASGITTPDRGGRLSHLANEAVPPREREAGGSSPVSPGRFISLIEQSSQVKIFFNDGSLNKHFTCFFTSSHQNREKEREVKGWGGGGRGEEESSKSEQIK